MCSRCCYVLLLVVVVVTVTHYLFYIITIIVISYHTVGLLNEVTDEINGTHQPQPKVKKVVTLSPLKTHIKKKKKS